MSLQPCDTCCRRTPCKDDYGTFCRVTKLNTPSQAVPAYAAYQRSSYARAADYWAAMIPR